jgi:hypothetical protein
MTGKTVVITGRRRSPPPRRGLRRRRRDLILADVNAARLEELAGELARSRRCTVWRDVSVSPRSSDG